MPGRAFQAEGSVSAKALGQQCTWHKNRRSDCLKSCEPGKGSGKWQGEAGRAGSLRPVSQGIWLLL